MIRWAKSSLTDDQKMKQILATHSPNGLEIDILPLLKIIEDAFSNRAILHVASPTINAEAEAEGQKEEKALVTKLSFEAESEAERSKEHKALVAPLPSDIDRISSEICYSTQINGADVDATTLSLFNMLAKYSWDAKLVLTMAAFALNYAKFFLLLRLYPSTNRTIIKTLATIKGLPFIFEYTNESIKCRSDEIDKLIQAMMDATRSVVKFRKLPPVYISLEASALSTALAHIPTVVYLIIRSIVACSTEFASFTNVALGTVRELSELTEKLVQRCNVLKQQLEICQEHIEKKRNVEAYLKLLNCFDTANKDNIESLKAFIKAKDGDLPLFNGATKKEVDINVLRRKNVLLLISGLDISQDELWILKLIFREANIIATRHERQYEVVWVPITNHSVQRTDLMENEIIKNLKYTMPWYSVQNPTLIDKVVIKLIKEVWHFRNNTVLVALDSQGRVVSPYALHLMWIWGSHAFPFTRSRQESLWKDETWRLELLVDGLDATILRWAFEEKHIFIFGGDDVEWVKTFTATAREVAHAARFQLELVYVGNRSKRDKIKQIIDSIEKDKLNTYFWHDLTAIWYFWTRLESMLFCKIQLGNKFEENDGIMQELKKLLSYEKEGRWAMLTRGSNIMVNGAGAKVLHALTEYDPLNDLNSPNQDFGLSFKDHYNKINTGTSVHSCCRFSFPTAARRFPKRTTCPECHRIMAKQIVLSCCHKGISEIPF
eukprot:XP_015579512.2 protein SIEVE ELEMENT OCCLUSION B [Ricinus communis]